MKRSVSGPAAAGPYSPGIVAKGTFLFVSGQGSIRDGQVVPGDIAAQTRLSFENLRAVLREAGADYADIVRCGVFLTDADDYDEFNRVYRQLLPEPLPTRTTVVAGLLAGMRVEIDCIAVLGADGD